MRFLVLQAGRLLVDNPSGSFMAELDEIACEHALEKTACSEANTVTFQTGLAKMEWSPRGFQMNQACYAILKEDGSAEYLLQQALRNAGMPSSREVAVLEMGSRSIQVLSTSNQLVRLVQLSPLPVLQRLSPHETLTAIEQFLAARCRVLLGSGLWQWVEQLAQPQAVAKKQVEVHSAVSAVLTHQLDPGRLLSCSRVIGTAAFRAIQATMGALEPSDHSEDLARVQAIDHTLRLFNPIASNTEAKLTKLSMEPAPCSRSMVVSPGSTSQDVVFSSGESVEIKLAIPMRDSVVVSQSLELARQQLQPYVKLVDRVVVATNSKLKEELKRVQAHPRFSPCASGYPVKALLELFLDSELASQCVTLNALARVFGPLDDSQALQFEFQEGSTKLGMKRLLECLEGVGLVTS